MKVPHIHGDEFQYPVLGQDTDHHLPVGLWIFVNERKAPSMRANKISTGVI